MQTGPGATSIPTHQNGVVDGADYTVWRDTLGSISNLAANGNGNSVIDAGDYDLWKQSFGRASGAGSDSSALCPSQLRWQSWYWRSWR